MIEERYRSWIEVAVGALATIILYRFGFGLFFFLVPLQIIAIRRGEEGLLYAGVAAGAIILVWQLAATSRPVPVESIGLTSGASGALFLVQVAVVGLLISSLWVLNSSRFAEFDRVQRILGCSAAAGLIAIPVGIYLQSNDALQSQLEPMFAAVSEAMAVWVSGAEVDDATTRALLNPGELMRSVRDVLSRSICFYFAIILTGGYWLGSVLGARTLRQSPRVARLARFRIDDKLVWPLLIGWAIVLFDTRLEIGFLGLVGWNVALIFHFLFGLQGLGILRSWFERQGAASTVRTVVTIAVGVILIMTRFWVVALAAIPILGVSEIWVNYGRFEPKEGAE